VSATLALLGDVMLGRGVNAKIGREAPTWFWGDTLATLRSADAVIANLECAITTHRRPWLRTPKVFHFRAGPEATAVLRAGRVGCVSLANNHTLDFETEGLLDTLKYLDEAGIAHAGAGAGRHEAAEPAMIAAGDMKIGFLAATDNEPPFAAGNDMPGTHYIRVNTRPSTLIPFQRAIDNLRGRGADLIVLSMHWGPNMVLRPPRDFQRFARAMIDRGVDLIHGHSAHVMQGVEIYNGRPILYDTGDFLDDYAVDPELRNDWSAIFLAEIEGVLIRRLRAVPVRLRFARTQLARGGELDAIRERMTGLSEAMGTTVVGTDEGIRIGVAERVEAHH